MNSGFSTNPGKAWAVITGASAGLGRAFADNCAGRGDNLFLADLPGTGLPALAENLTSSGIEVRAIECDLSREEGRSAFLTAILESQAPLSLLVNNVGVGHNGLFDRLPYEAAKAAIDLNIGATVALTHGLVPALGKTRGSRIITVASLAAFYPMPLFAIYSSTKAFLLSWSLALRQELSDLGIGVTVLAPGGMYTNEETREKVRSQGLSGRLSTMEPAEVAAFALAAADRNKAIAIPGLFNKLLWLAGSHAPKNLVAASIRSRWEHALSRLPESSGACFRP